MKLPLIGSSFKRFMSRVMGACGLLALLLSSVNLIQAGQSVGVILPAHAITGSATLDRIGSGGVVALSNGNIVIVSPGWSSGRGAVTCLTPAEYKAGNIVVSASNSLVGAGNGDNVGSGGITLLTNGNFVVKSPSWDAAPNFNQGAATLVNGTTCIPANEDSPDAVVSVTNSLVGVTNSDAVGAGVVALDNGNYLVKSSYWDIPAGAVDVGSLTWGDGDTGIVGAVNAANSLIGSTANDRVGAGDIYQVGTDNYVVVSSVWDNGAAIDAGAVTWGDGDTGLSGAVSAANSLVGSSATDMIGSFGVTVISDGDYVVKSPQWDDGATTNVGAATWGDGDTGVVGTINSTNSLIGVTAGDGVSTAGVHAVKNGNYIVSSPAWDNGLTTDAGAVTWCDGTSGCVGTVTTANSLVGDTANDLIGFINVLSNGNYLVQGLYWHGSRGAVTWADGDVGIVGTVSAANSIVGSTANDGVGNTNSVVELSNGHYVIGSPTWDDGPTADVGAVTWCSGVTGCTGLVSTSNSWVGSTAGDNVGTQLTALNNGNFIFSAFSWDNGATANVGAVKWVNGSSGSFGLINSSNALVGLTAHDAVGGITVLTNGNYLVRSSSWDNGANINAGALTWCDGTIGCTGAVSAANSLVGSSTHDTHGGMTVTVLPNGNYVMGLILWDDGATADVGAVAWGNGATGTVGTISAANALIGSTVNDRIGFSGIYPLTNGDYVVSSDKWTNTGVGSAGAITLASGAGGTVGVVSAANSIVGTVADDMNNSAVLGVVTLPTEGYIVVASRWDNGLTADVGAVLYGLEDDAPVNLLTNGGFETAGATAKKADNWTVKNPKTTDRRLCNTLAKPLVTAEGGCVFQFSTGSAPEKARSLKQILTGGDLGGAGETLTLSVMAEGNKFKQGAKIILTVTYTDNTTAKVNLPITKGTYAFTELTSTLNLTKTVQKIVVNINIAKMTGRVRLDDLWLTLSDTARLAFPLNTREGATSESPSAPDDFRSGN